MKGKLLATAMLISGSALLSACGGTAATPVATVATTGGADATASAGMMAGGTATGGAMMTGSPSAMMAGETPSAMMAASPSAMMGETPSAGAMMSGSPSAMMGGETPTGGAMMSGSPSVMMAGSPSAMMGETPTGGAMMSGTPSAGMMTGTGTPASGGATGGLKRKIVVSSKDFTEEFILGEMYALVLEKAGVPVERKLNLGATDIAQGALLKGGGAEGIDLYPEYTSTGLNNVLKKDPIYDPKQVLAAVKEGYKQFNLVWLDPSPMNDTQAMVTSKEIADKYGLKSLQDLCDKADQLTVAAVAEFKDRADALPLLQKTYGGCKFKDIKVFAPNLRYKALLSKDVDIAQAFSTDGPIAGNNLILLADPKNYGLPYNVAPVVRQDVLDLYPQITDTLNKLSPMITNEEISALNWEVDGKGREYADVAKEWLQKKGMLK